MRAVLIAIAALAACEDRSYRTIGADIGVLTERDDLLVPPATARLVARGRNALPQIETALHTAPVKGRLNLLLALERIADPDALAVLRHFAVYDPAPEVRAACEAILGRWPGGGTALARVRDKRSRGAAP